MRENNIAGSQRGPGAGAADRRESAGLQAGGIWFAVASGLLIISLLLHAVPSPDPAEFMAIIAAEGGMWIAAHWLAAVSLALFAVSGLLVLASRSRLTRVWWSVSAWAILVIGALWVSVTAVMEATAVAHVAAVGDLATYEPWEAFAEGMAMGFLGIALAIAGIALYEAREAVAVAPAWASWVGFAAAGIAALGWLLATVFNVPAGGFIWLVTTIIVALWGVWFGVGLARSGPLQRADR